MNDENKKKFEKITSLHQAALKLSEAGENQRALELLGYALELDQDSAPTHVLLGLTYQSLGKPKETEEHFFKAIALDPENTEAIQGLGLFLAANERKADGAEWLIKCLDHNNWGKKEIVEKVTELLDELGRQGDALILLRKAWLKSRKTEVGELYARYLEAKGKRDEAYLTWKFIAMQPKESADFFMIGLILWSEHKYEEAIQYLEIAVYLNDFMSPADPGFSFEEYEAAGDTWPYVNDDDPHDLGWCHYLIALCYLELKDGNKALEAIEDAMWTYGAGPLEYIRRAEALILLERFEEAIQNVHEGLAQLGEDEFSEDWGESLLMIKTAALIKIDEYKEALETLKKGIRKYPESLVLYSSAFEQMMYLGMFAEAAHIFEKAIRKGVKIQTPDHNRMYIRCLAFSGRNTIPKAIKEGLIQGKSETEIISIVTDIFSALQDYPSICKDYLRYLNAHVPNNSLLLNFLAMFLANQGDLGKAESILLRALGNIQSTVEEQVIQNNLGYIYLLRGKFANAEACFHAVLDIDTTDGIEGPPTIFEVAFYWGDEIIPDYLPIASRAINAKSAALANLATLALSREDNDTAAKHSIQVLSIKPENSLGYETLAFTFLARGNQRAGLETLDKALDRIGEEEAPLLALSLMHETIEFELTKQLSE